MKTCYYEILEISRDVSPDEIRRAYRRQALLLHPDKNMHRVEEATQKFAQVQAAYEILSDPDERAWYDSHREQILQDEAPTLSGGFARTSTSSAGTTTQDILRFFDPGLFSIIDDSEIGFFTIARKVFEQLAEEETDADDSSIRLPGFGDSRSSWADETKYFYAAWNGFSTKKSFDWFDQYRLADAPDRRVRRAMEKENKKLRDAAKKEYNDTIKAFVAFIRKRDPRLKQSAAQNEQRQHDMATKVKEQAAKAREAHRKRFKTYEDQDWTTPDYDEQFWDEEYTTKPKKEKAKDEDAESVTPAEAEANGDYDDDDEDEIVVYECIFCKKTFKSEKQLGVHERSNKHQKMVRDVIRRMKKENAEIGLDNASEDEFKDAHEDLSVEDLAEEVSQLYT
ncbi:DnaJ domain-containing protein [Lipomyces tetrasporus]|uniref:DnaJ domain-containing protein n=1 Tax=Lipomyces tetrasporus TaxID=54092 RepID=A0AAD7VPV7_9ASCO|nr:DnaJ domain-containing protein [Lipomyces tetrasporus]KAJ8096505.1 DnaJ domain-containing protein [Lipomyces tetrasporus]